MPIRHEDGEKQILRYSLRMTRVRLTIEHDNIDPLADTRGNGKESEYVQRYATISLSVAERIMNCFVKAGVIYCTPRRSRIFLT